MKTTHRVLSLSLLSTLLAATSIAHANDVHASFTDVTGSVSLDGWNELNRNRVGGALTEAELVAGTGSNTASSGDAVLTRVSGNHYPAGSGLYGSASVLSFTDSTVGAGVGTLVFQGIVNIFDAAPLSLTLSYNGGSQSLVASSSTSVSTGGAADYYSFSWDLSSLATPVSAYTLTLNAGFSQMLAFQVDQVVATPVPEPSTYALLIGGLGMIGAIARRRHAKV